MRGIITTRHLVTKAATIVGEFGIAAYFRCVAAAFSKRPVTFLECVMRCSPEQSDDKTAVAAGQHCNADRNITQSALPEQFEPRAH